MEEVFSAENRPWRRKRHECDLGRETGKKRRGMGFGQQGHLRLRGGGPQKRHRQRDVAEAPELDDEQSRR